MRNSRRRWPSTGRRLEARIAPLLNAHPFEVIAWEFSKAFGNFYVDYRFPEFLLRLVQDRSQLFLEVASLASPEDWKYSLSVRELFTGERVLDLPEIEVQAQIIIDHYSEIASAFEPAVWPSTKERLDALAEAERAVRIRCLATRLWRPIELGAIHTALAFSLVRFFAATRVFFSRSGVRCQNNARPFAFRR